MNTILDIQNVEEEYEIEGQYHEHSFYTKSCKILAEGENDNVIIMNEKGEEIKVEK